MRIENRLNRSLCSIGYLVLAALLLASCGGNDRCANGPEDQDHLPIVQVGDLDEPLKVLDSATPIYPDEARRQGHEGSVTVTVIVNSDGTVGRSEVSTNSGYPELDSAALDAAIHFKFTEPRRHGCPVRVELDIPFRFSLGGRPVCDLMIERRGYHGQPGEADQLAPGQTAPWTPAPLGLTDVGRSSVRGEPLGWLRHPAPGTKTRRYHGAWPMIAARALSRTKTG